MKSYKEITLFIIRSVVQPAGETKRHETTDDRDEQTETETETQTQRGETDTGIGTRIFRPQPKPFPFPLIYLLDCQAHTHRQRHTHLARSLRSSRCSLCTVKNFLGGARKRKFKFIVCGFIEPLSHSASQSRPFLHHCQWPCHA